MLNGKSSSAASRATHAAAPDPLAAAADVASSAAAQDLAGQLAEKEAVIVALTSQLELAAEQLDRLQRSGADRRRGTGALPPELVNDHKQLVGELQRVVQQWEDMQAGLALGRIEIQLSELRDFIAERLQGSIGAVRVETPESPPVLQEPVTLALHGHGEHEPAEAAQPATSAWDLIKSELLGEPAAPALDASGAPEPLPEPPAAIDWQTATPEALGEAIVARDEFIAVLLRRLRAAEQTALPDDWSACAAAAPELTARLQQLAGQLDEKLRLAEVELSLERAKLSRDQSRLKLQQETLDKQLKRLGLSSADDASAAAAPAVAPPDRRWVRFLGVPRSS